MLVGGDHQQGVALAQHQSLAGLHHPPLLGGGEPRRDLVDVAALHHVSAAGHQLAYQAGLPRAPRRRAGGHRIGLGERSQQTQGLHRAGLAGHVGNGVGIFQVAPGGHVGQQQMVLHHGHQHVYVGGRVPHAVGDVGHQLHTHLGMVAGVALADVVEQGPHHQQVGAVHPVDQISGQSGGLT